MCIYRSTCSGDLANERPFRNLTGDNFGVSSYTQINACRLRDVGEYTNFVILCHAEKMRGAFRAPCRHQITDVDPALCNYAIERRSDLLVFGELGQAVYIGLTESNTGACSI